MQRLNLGCGRDIILGWVNLDSKALPGVDVVHDLEFLPLPFATESFDEILCQDVLEHLDYVPVLEEIHRILRPGGTLTVRVPHFTSKNAYTDPTHRKFFAARTFYFFTKESLKGRDYYFRFSFDRVLFVRLTFEQSSPIFFFNRMVEPLVNMSRYSQYLYESTFLSRLFPAENIVVSLRK